MKEYQDQINERQTEINEKVSKHLEIANQEMGAIKEDIAEIKVHVNWIREIYDSWEKRWDKLDNRIWLILSTIIIGFLISIYLK